MFVRVCLMLFVYSGNLGASIFQDIECAFQEYVQQASREKSLSAVVHEMHLSDFAQGSFLFSYTAQTSYKELQEKSLFISQGVPVEVSQISVLPTLIPEYYQVLVLWEMISETECTTYEKMMFLCTINTTPTLSTIPFLEFPKQGCEEY